MNWLWIVLYFLIGFIIDVCIIVYDIKNGDFNKHDESNIVMVTLVFALWPFVIVGLAIIGFANGIMFLGEVISKWIS